MTRSKNAAKKLLTILLFIFLLLSCKKPPEKIENLEPQWQPNFRFAEFMNQIAKECIKGRPGIIEFKNPGFTEIISTSPYMIFMADEFTVLSPYLRSKIEGKVPMDEGTKGKVYFIKNHDTIVMEVQVGELPCSFSWPKNTLGTTIYGINDKAHR